MNDILDFSFPSIQKLAPRVRERCVLLLLIFEKRMSHLVEPFEVSTEYASLQTFL
jgi:hypothetical protein